MRLKTADGAKVVLAAGPKRKRTEFFAPTTAWQVAHDITLERVETRIRRWWLTNNALPDPERRYLKDMKALWPDPSPDRAFDAFVLYDSPDARERQNMRAVRFVPTPEDISDYYGTRKTNPWVWMRQLAPDEVKLIRAVHLLGASYIAKRRKCSRQLISKMYRDSIMRAWHAAIIQVRSDPAQAQAADGSSQGPVRLHGAGDHRARDRA